MANTNPFERPGTIRSHPKDEVENPFRPPSELRPSTKSDSLPELDEEFEREGLPWENKGPLIRRFLATLRMVLFEPAHAFSRMRRQGGVLSPLMYYVLGSMIAAVANVIYQTSLSSSLLPEDLAPQAYGPIFMAIGLVFAPILYCGMAYMSSAIYHVLLIILPGSPKTYETTFRVYCYAKGSNSLWSLIPFVGVLVTFVTSVVSLIIGLSKAHNVAPGVAATAILAPLAFLFFGFVVLFLTVFIPLMSDLQ